MAWVKTKDIPFNERYVYMVLDQVVLDKPLISNLEMLYEFIDIQLSPKRVFKNGSAYTLILKRAREIAGYRKNIISRRQVKAIINVQRRKNDICIRIPYASEYIFKAIFDIFEGYKKDPSINIPPEIEKCYGQIRREVFYCKQCEQYKYKFTNNLLNDRNELRELRHSLLNDICSEECSLGKEF